MNIANADAKTSEYAVTTILTNMGWTKKQIKNCPPESMEKIVVAINDYFMRQAKKRERAFKKAMKLFGMSDIMKKSEDANIGQLLVVEAAKWKALYEAVGEEMTLAVLNSLVEDGIFDYEMMEEVLKLIYNQGDNNEE